jgi:16S rRNA G966 N2-methylase RsmD
MEMDIINKIFPQTSHMEKLQYDLEGLWSISLPNDAENISEIIKTYSGENISIFDGMGGLGGNIISFSKHFKEVITCELSKKRYDMLTNNINVYNLKNVKIINDDCLNHINNLYDVYFFDPPWGGPNYKNNIKTTIKIGDYNLYEVIEKIKSVTNALIFMKLPLNYNLEEFTLFNYNINKIKNYYLLTFF